MRHSNPFHLAASAILVTAAVLGTFPAASAAEIVVFAAASLKEALDDAARIYGAQSGDAVKISYAASSALAKQIESGAPADMFISADLELPHHIMPEGLELGPASRRAAVFRLDDGGLEKPVEGVDQQPSPTVRHAHRPPRR